MRKDSQETSNDRQWATSVVALLKAAVKAQRKPPSGRWCSRGSSALDPFRFELTELRTHGATMRELQLWVAANGGVEVERSTIWRRLQKWGVE